jgi:hypothetical protein
MKKYGEWRYSSVILDLSTGLRWAASFTSRSLYPRGWETGWAPESVWMLWRKVSCICWDSKPGHPTRSPSLRRLSYPGSIVWGILHFKIHDDSKTRPASVISCEEGEELPQFSPVEGTRFDHYTTKEVLSTAHTPVYVYIDNVIYCLCEIRTE